MYQIDIFTYFYFVDSEMYFYGKYIYLSTGRAGKVSEKVMLKDNEKG